LGVVGCGPIKYATTMTVTNNKNHFLRMLYICV
jgi:hypothetical protein